MDGQGWKWTGASQRQGHDMSKKSIEAWTKRVCLLGLIATLFIIGCSRPPQVIDNDECFAAVEALWTAVTSKRTDLLEQAATELNRLHKTGSLSDAGHAELDQIVQMARQAEWRPAAEDLKEFMLGQRKSR